MINKKIKQQLYAKGQRIKATFPAGLGAAALEEVNSILNAPWFKQKFTPVISLAKNAIRINEIHLFEAIELMLRSQCLSDVRLIILESKAVTKSGFEKKCKEIDWEYYLDPSMTVRIRVNSVASLAFHEGALKEILTEIISPFSSVVKNNEEEPTTTLYADLYKNKLTVSLSLAGEALYKRGYRGKLSASAPVREDAAACCIRNALQFARSHHPDYVPETVLIPFSGTGTFLFEYLLIEGKIAPALLKRTYALQQMPLFRAEHFNYLLKKAEGNCLPLSQVNFYCIDTSEKAGEAITVNLANFNKTIPIAALSKNPFIHGDFLKQEVELTKNVFIPLNPPYGFRMGKTEDTLGSYKKIAQQLNQLKKSHCIAGFIFCPTEEIWSLFCNVLQDANITTYHFTQGGLDIRVCQFC